MCTHDGTTRECVFVAECVIEGMPRLSSACAGFPGCPCDVWDPSCLRGKTGGWMSPDDYSNLNEYLLHLIISLIMVRHNGGDGYSKQC